MNVVREKLLAAQQKARESLKEILDEYVGQVSIIEYTPETWSSLIGLALLSGVTFTKFGDEFGTAAEDVVEWLNGNPPRRPETAAAVVKFIVREVCTEAQEAA